MKCPPRLSGKKGPSKCETRSNKELNYSRKHDLTRNLTKGGTMIDVTPLYYGVSKCTKHVVGNEKFGWREDSYYIIKHMLTLF